MERCSWCGQPLLPRQPATEIGTGRMHNKPCRDEYHRLAPIWRAADRNDAADRAARTYGDYESCR